VFFGAYDENLKHNKPTTLAAKMLFRETIFWQYKDYRDILKITWEFT